MEISIEKTEVMQVSEQDRVAPATVAELKSVCKFECPHAGCSRVFHNAHGCKCHAGKCRFKNFYAVDKILAVRGDTGSTKREFLIRWQGYGPEDDQWEPRKHIHPDLIKEFLMSNNLYDYNWPGARCPWCDKPCKNARGVKIHMNSCTFKPDKQQFAGTCAEKKVKENKIKAAQALKRKISCEGAELRNVYLFKYLGSIFAADGSHEPDVKRRIALAMQRMGALRHVFNSAIPLPLKLKIYKTAICSLLTYGCEAWSLDEKTLAMLNGANARCLSWFTGKDSHTEASVRTRTYDLVHAIRVRRFRWLGHILRLDEDRLVQLAVEQQFKLALPGNMFYDVPHHLTYRQIKNAASDRVLWKRLSKLLRPHSSDAAGKERKFQMHKMSLLIPASPPPPPRPRERAGATTRAAKASQPTATPPTKQKVNPPSKSDMKMRLRVRAAHKRLFAPKSGQTSRPTPVKTKVQKPRPMTNKQRAAEAHAHFIIHHGSRQDAAGFLKSNTRARHIRPATVAMLESMCPSSIPKTTKSVLTAPPDPKSTTTTRPLDLAQPTTPTTKPTTPTPTIKARATIPTWEEARAAVFSSSSEESLSPSSPPPSNKAPPTSKWDTTALSASNSSCTSCSSIWAAAAPMDFSTSGSSVNNAHPDTPPSPSTTINLSSPAHTSKTASPTNLPFSPKLSPINKWAEDSHDADAELTQDDSSPTRITPQPPQLPKAPATTSPSSPLPRSSRITRSRTANKRRLEEANVQCREQHLRDSTKRAKKKRSRHKPKPSIQPKAVKVAPSSVKGAGLGLYILEDVKKDEFVARYSGEVIDRIVNAARTGHYRIQISKNVFLDAEKLHHFEGRFINDGKRAGRGVNVRFAAGYQLNTCSITNLKWIRIFATRDIRAGEELFLDYGPEFWDDLGPANPAKQTQLTSHFLAQDLTPTTTALSPIRRAPRSELQRSQPFSGILLHQPPSPWAPTTTPPRIHGYYNTHSKPQHTHTHTTMNDSSPPYDISHNNTLILNDTLRIMNTTHILL